MIELVDAAPAKPAPKPQLVRSHAVGNDVRDVPGKVAAAFGGRKANLLKVADLNVWRAENGLSVVKGTGAEEQSHGMGIKAIIKVVKDLIKIVGADEHLIGEPTGEGGVEDQRFVENVEGRHFEVVLQVRAGRSQCGAAAEWGRLAALSAKEANIEMVLVINLIIDLGDAIVAIASRSYGAEEIVVCGCKAADQTPGPEALRTHKATGAPRPRWSRARE